MKPRLLRTLAGVLAASAVALSGSGWAVNTATVNASVSGSTLSVSGSASTSGLPSGSYSAALTVTNSSGQTVISGSSSFVISGGTGTMTLTTVDGVTYSSGMPVSNTSPSICGTYSSPSDVMAGYIAVMEPSGAVRRYQLMSAPTGNSFCANIVLDSGQNTVWAAYVSLASGQLVYSTNQLAISNVTSSVTAGSVRIQLTWDQVNDMDLHMYSPSAAGGTATTSSYGEHIYYSNKNHTWGQLDIDKLTSNGGLGPENITVNSFPVTPGRYLVTVYAYSTSGYSSTNCTITIYTGAGTTLLSQNFTLTSIGQTYTVGYVNVRADGTYTIDGVGTFAGDAGNGMGRITEPPAGYTPPPKD